MCQVATGPGIQKAAIRITASSVVTKCSIEWVILTLLGSKQAQVGGLDALRGCKKLVLYIWIP